MSDPFSTSARFDIGRVIQRTFGAVGRNFPVFLGLSVLMTGLPQALLGWFSSRQALAPTDLSPANLGGMGIAGLVTIVFAFVLQAALTHGAIQDMNGQKASFSDSFRTGLRNFLPVLGISILAGLGIGLGFVLLIVPGIMLAVLWSVVVPSQVAEKTGVLKAFGRSRELTRGHRWSIFALMLIYGVVSWIFAAVLVGVAALISGSFIGMANAANSIPVQVIFSPLISSVSSMIGAAGVASIYYELRVVKDGIGPQTLADIFS